jgi:hypothetical protein
VVESCAPTRTQQPVRADLGEASRKDMPEEARQEDVDRKRVTPGLSGAGVGVAEGDAPVSESFEGVIAEGDAIDVAREIAARMLASPDLLHVHGPAPLPNPRIDIAEEARARQRIAHLRAKHFGEHVAGHEKAWVRWLDPRRAVDGEPAGSDEEVRVGDGTRACDSTCAAPPGSPACRRPTAARR